MKYLALVFVVAGCGAEIDDLYGEGSSSGGGGDGSGASTSTSQSNGGGPSSSSSNAGGAPTSSNTTNATTSNAGGMATDVAATNATTGPDPSVQQATTGMPQGIFVQCGDGACDVSEGNVCCLQATGSSCVPENECGAFGAPVSCDDPFDCDGDKVCCGHTDGGLYDEIRCESQCEWPNRTLCTPGGPACEPIPGDNGPIATQCGQSSVLPDGYLVCKP